MAPFDREDIQRRLEKLHKKLSLIEKNLEHIPQHYNAKDDSMLPNLVKELEELKTNQQAARTEFYQLLAPFYEGDIQFLQFSQLPDVVFPVVVGADKDAELVGLAERLQEFQRIGDERHERLEELMKNFRTVPKPSTTGIAINESDDKKRKLSDRDGLEDVNMGLQSLDLRMEVEDTQEVKQTQETEEAKGTQETEEAGIVLRLSDIAMKTYGFSEEIAMEIEKSLQNKKLVQDDTQFLKDEAALGLDDLGKGKEQQHETESENWVMVKKLKMKFQELKKGLYGEAPNITASDQLVAFLRVLRNWIFHIESVLFALLYGVDEMLSGTEVEKTTLTKLQNFVSNLRKLMEVEDAVVPIVVYKAVKLMDRLVGSMKSTEEEISSRQERYENNLMEALNSSHEIMKQLSTVLFTASLTNTRLIIQAEIDSLEELLDQKIEEDVRKVEGKIKLARSTLRGKWTGNLNEASNKRQRTE